MEYEDSIPIERPPTLPVTEILAAERQERSWESAPIVGWCRPTMADRGLGIGDLGMAGLNIARQHVSREEVGTPAGGSQHTAGRKLRGAAPHIFRLFLKGGLPAAA
jgi:hypothetical protein